MDFKVYDLGLTDFETSLLLQKDIFSRVKSAELSSGLMLCRHYPVITLGRSSSKNNILASAEALKQRKIKLCETERGGDVTYHGPGQITAYPIFNLNYLKKDIHWFLRELEGVVIDFLSGFGIAGNRQPGLTGVWVDNKKIASVGIAVKNWISYHGLSININQDDLGGFNLIRPCGMDIKMTSVENCLSERADMEHIKKLIIYSFNNRFTLYDQAR